MLDLRDDSITVYRIRVFRPRPGYGIYKYMQPYATQYDHVYTNHDINIYMYVSWYVYAMHKHIVDTVPCTYVR